MDPWSLNLRQLGALAATVRTGSASRGAQAAGISQPAVTQAIGRLERSFAVALFARHPGGMTATAAGLVLAARIDRATAYIASTRVTAVQARALLLVAEHGGYAGASVASGLSQPSLHRAVADLAIALRRAVLERRGKTVALTQAGQRIVRRFRLAQAELAAGIAEVAAIAGRETGQIVVGAMPLCRARLLPAAVAAFHADHPDFSIRILEGSYAELIEPLHDGRVDVMIGALRNPEPGAVTRALFVDRPVVVARAGHPLAAAIAHAAALASYPWIVPAPGTPLRTLWEQLFASTGQPAPAVPVECGSVITIRQILRTSDFLTLLSPDQIAAELEAGWLVPLADAPPASTRTIGTTTRGDWQPTPLQAAFIATLTRLAALT